MEFKDLQKMVFEEYAKHGFLYRWERAHSFNIQRGTESLIDIAELALAAFEIGEAVDEIQKKKRPDVGKELADAIIRVMNYASRQKIDLEQCILEKHKENMKREHLHGKVI